MMHPFPLPHCYPSSGLPCGRVLASVLCAHKTANRATRPHQGYSTLTPKIYDRAVIALSHKRPVNLLTPPTPANTLWFISGYTPECGRVTPIFHLTPTKTHSLEMAQVRGRVTPVFHPTATKIRRLEMTQACGRVTPFFPLTPTKTHNLEMTQVRGRVVPVFHPTATKIRNLEMTQTRGRVRQICRSAKRQSPHPDSAFFNRVSSIGGLAPQTTSVSTTPLFGRYLERYQGGTGRYQQAVPGHTRRYWQLPKAVPAQYRAVRRYHLGITFSPVPPGRYPVPGQKEGDTGAVRAVGIAQTGITLLTHTHLTANAVHEVKPQSPVKWHWLHSHLLALVIPSRIKRGDVVNQNEGVVFAVTNEQGVVVCLAQQGPEHGFHFESIQTAFPDAIIWHRGTRYRVEFEYKARSFLHHQHDPRECDLIICWQNDYLDSILPVLALSDPSWPNTPLTLPDTLTRELTYWRERALVLERQLNRHWLSCPQAPLAKVARPRPMQTGMANQQATILALHAQGLTEREIGLQLYGQSDEPTRSWIRFVLERRSRKDEISRGIHRSDLYPFSPERPPTPEEQAHIHELHALGFSRNRICHTVYGFKNGKVYGWIIDTLAELGEEDEEETEPVEHIIA